MAGMLDLYLIDKASEVHAGIKCLSHANKCGNHRGLGSL